LENEFHDPKEDEVIDIYKGLDLDKVKYNDLGVALIPVHTDSAED